MDTSASKPVLPADTQIDMPDKMFFGAKDYAPDATPRAKPTTAQLNVSRYRSDMLGGLIRSDERLGTALRNIRVADECGMITAAIDIALATAGAVVAKLQELSDTVDKAETRYEQAIEQGRLGMPIASAVSPLIAGFISGLPVPASPLLTGEATARIRAERAANEASSASGAWHGRVPGRGGW